jgi:hypothetical protein
MYYEVSDACKSNKVSSHRWIYHFLIFYLIFSALAKWISEEAKITRINEVTKVVFNKLMDKIENLVCIFYDMEEDPTVENLQKIAGGCQENNIGIVKINDASEAEKYGLKDQPIAMFIHKNIPSLMVGNIEDPDEVGLSCY